MRANLGKAGKGKTLRLFCAECFLASGICWGGGRGGGVVRRVYGAGGERWPIFALESCPYWPFRGCVQGRGLSSWEASVTLYLWFRF